MTLTHVNAEGRARMVDVGDKAATHRVATAEGRVTMSERAYGKVERNEIAKGDVLRVAELAGVMGAKQTSSLIPLCHPLALDRITVVVSLEPSWPGVRIVATASITSKTGVEMEALTAVSVACLTVYDMVKAVDRETRIEGIRLLEKSGGTHGHWQADQAQEPQQKEQA